MRIRAVRIENFRAIRRLTLKKLPDAIVVAGLNGCGKSSLFDALRLLKSAYGQYHQNEYQHWFNEFQIDIKRVAQESHRVFHDTSRPVIIRAEFELADSEKEYLRNNAREFYKRSAWARVQGQQTIDGDVLMVNPALARTETGRIERQVDVQFRDFEQAVAKKRHVAQLTLAPGRDPTVMPSPVVELVFGTYRPEHLGVMDYHGPHRTYVREQVGSVNLNIPDPNARQGQNTLYNTQNKYRGIKSEMAQVFVRQLLAERFGSSVPREDDLKDTLDELFAQFFPGKKFLGPQPTKDGGLSFPVRLENGREHDINELSSGEKEVLLGYLRLRNTAPRNSIILLDEPEIHLNPKLIRGLPRFYQRHIGEALGNQIWLITHSDTLLREAVDEPAYAVFHMRSSHEVPAGEDQIDRVSATAEVEGAILDLVGDLASYSPRSKVVLVEGENSQFDESMLRELFPEFSERVNVVSVGSKARVRGLHAVLDRASEEGHLDARFYSITDRDADAKPIVVDGDRSFTWDVYHIENYLLSPKHIRLAIEAVALGDAPTEGDITVALKECAQESIETMVRIRMNNLARTAISGCLLTGYDPASSPSEGLRSAAERSHERLNKLLKGDLSEDSLQKQEEQVRAEMEAALANDSWQSEFRGRDVLKRFVGMHHADLGVRYDRFRNIIINRMREDGYRPPGMQAVVDRIEGK